MGWDWPNWKPPLAGGAPARQQLVSVQLAHSRMCLIWSCYCVEQLQAEGTCNLPVAGIEAALSRAAQQHICVILGIA